MRARATILLLLALFGAFMVWRSSGADSGQAVRPASAGGAAPERAETALPAPPASEPMPRRPAATEPEQATIAPAPEAPAPELVTLEGTWTVLDTDEVERGGVSGHFVVRLYGSREDIEIPVQDGRWSIALPAQERFDVREVELGGRRTAPVGDVGALGAPPGGGELDLVARWMREVVLTVVDARSRRPLSDLIVVGEGMGTAWEHPGDFEPERVILRGVSSPVILPVPDYPDDHAPLWVRGPQHAWGHIVVPRSVGGDFLLALQPAGSLVATLVGAPEIESGVALVLRLRRNDDPEDWEGIRFEEWLEGRTRIELGALPAEPYVVTVELGHRYRYPRVLAAQAVDLSSVARAEVTLDVSAFEPPLLTTIAGTLVVSPAWELSSMGLQLNLIDEPAVDGQPQRWIGTGDMRLVDAARGEYAFALADIQAGRWELRFNPLGTSLAVDVPESGLEGVRLDVPPPVEVTVRIHDPAGAPVSDAELYWMPDRSELDSGGVLNQAGLAAPGRFAFTAPQGRVEVWCISQRWSFHRQVVDLEPGTHELTLEATPACGVVLSVREAGTRLRVEDFAPVISLAESDEEAYLSDEDFTGLTLRFVVPGPGLYRIELSPPAGYRAVDPVTLSIAAEEFAEVVVDVERE